MHPSRSRRVDDKRRDRSPCSSAPAKWTTHQLYKSLNRIPESELLHSLEELIWRTDLYDVLEFSHKYTHTNRGYICNPLRFTLYTSDCRIQSSFLKEGFDCFKQALRGTRAAAKLKDLQSSFARIEKKDLRCLALGIEINPTGDHTRLKAYGGYWTDPSLGQSIQRIELNLNGTMATCTYDYWTISDARARSWLSQLPVSVPANCFSGIFAQGTSLHFMMNHTVETAWKDIRQLMPGRSIRDRLSVMIRNGFRLFSMQVQKGDVRKGDLRSVTLYFR